VRRLRDPAASSSTSTEGKASGATNGIVKDAAASSAAPSSPTNESSRSLSTDGLIGGAARTETRRHEARVNGAGLGSAQADRSGADASVSPTASAHAGRK